MNRRRFLTYAAILAAYPAYRGIGSLLGDRPFHAFGGQLARLKAALADPSRSQIGISFIGDSITWGTGTGQGPNPNPRHGTLADPRDNYSSASYVNNIKRHIGDRYMPGAEVQLSNWPTSPSGQAVAEFMLPGVDGAVGKRIRITNQGINGASTSSYLFRNLVTAGDGANFALLPDDQYVFVQLGTNDRIVSPRNPKNVAELSGNIERLVTHIGDRAEVILMAANPSTIDSSEKYLYGMEVVRDSVLAAAQKCGVDFIDNYYAFQGLDLVAHMADGSHPNVKGHAVISRNIISAIEIA